MILNLMRVEDLRVEDMLVRSFAEFHAQRSVIDRRVNSPSMLLPFERLNHS